MANLRPGGAPTGPVTSDIWIVNSDGTDAYRLTECRTPTCTADFLPSWSPDGRTIAFWSMARAGGRWVQTLQSADASTGEVRTLLQCPGCGNAGPIAWSPDGARLAFSRSNDLSVMNADGTGLHQLTDCSRLPSAACAIDLEPAWSPDGQWIAFVRLTEDSGVPTIYLVRPDGSGVRSLGVTGFWPSWRLPT